MSLLIYIPLVKIWHLQMLYIIHLEIGDIGIQCQMCLAICYKHVYLLYIAGNGNTLEITCNICAVYTVFTYLLIKIVTLIPVN